MITSTDGIHQGVNIMNEIKTLTELIENLRNHSGYPITIDANELAIIGFDWSWWEDENGNHFNPEKIELQCFETIDFDFPLDPESNFLDIAIFFDGVEMDSGIDGGRCHWNDTKNTDSFVKLWFSKYTKG